MTPQKIEPSETVLFVGAGASVQLGLPSWTSLMGELGEALDFDPDIFCGYSSHMALAEYFQIKQESLNDLAKRLKQEWHNSKITIENSRLHKSIVELGFAKIYTTNFDHWLEKAFEHYKRPYHKIVGIKDLTGGTADAQQIIKFHGDLDDPESLVLTESSYFDRLEFNSPLDIQLRADVLRWPILFIGYSLTDVNMRYLFHKLRKFFADTKVERTSHIFMVKPNPVEEELFRRWKIEPILNEQATGAGLAEFLEGLRTSPS